MTDDTTNQPQPNETETETETVTVTETVTRSSTCTVCGSSDLYSGSCLNCGSVYNPDGTVALEGKPDSTDRVLGTTPAQPLPEAALVEQDGAPDLDRVRGTTPPQPLPPDAYNDPRVLGTTPPEPVPPLDPVPNVTYGDSTGATSDTPPAVHGDPVTPVAEPPVAELLNPDAAAAAADPSKDAAQVQQEQMPTGDSVGSQPQTDESYAVTSGFPSGETKIVTPGETPVEPEVAAPAPETTPVAEQPAQPPTAPEGQ